MHDKCTPDLFTNDQKLSLHVETRAPNYSKGIQYRTVTEEDRDYLYHLHVLTMKEYVDKTWGWEDAFQEAAFDQHFNPDEQKIITFNDKDAGVISIEYKDDEIFLRAIEVHPEYQRKGIGTFIIQSLIEEGIRQDKPVRLYVLKVNPAKKLYERLGFNVVSEITTHFIMRTDIPAGA